MFKLRLLQEFYLTRSSCQSTSLDHRISTLNSKLLFLHRQLLRCKGGTLQRVHFVVFGPSCFQLFPVFMLRWANQLLAVASYLSIMYEWALVACRQTGDMVLSDADLDSVPMFWCLGCGYPCQDFLFYVSVILANLYRQMLPQLPWNT